MIVHGVGSDNPKSVEVARQMRQVLTPRYGAREASAIVALIWHKVLGWNRTQMIVNEDRRLSDATLERLATVLHRLQAGEPVQYVLGEGRFFGLDFEVGPGVLIPRPETEELVELILSENRVKDLHVLDIGTGSGAIAVALARHLAYAEVTAVDISALALTVARRNARRHKTDIDFIEADIFRWSPEAGAFDIIVSNPPYVAESEKADMEQHVLDWEPPQALFVPDADPLRYYRRIAEIGIKALGDCGRLYFEVNPRFAREMQVLVSGYGYRDVRLHDDIQGRPRILSATAPVDP